MGSKNGELWIRPAEPSGAGVRGTAGSAELSPTSSKLQGSGASVPRGSEGLGLLGFLSSGFWEFRPLRVFGFRALGGLGLLGFLSSGFRYVGSCYP